VPSDAPMRPRRTAARAALCRRTARRIAMMVMLAGFLGMALPTPVASAHAYLLASTPPGGYAVPTAPADVSLDFDLPVTIGAVPLALTDSAGAPKELGPAALSLGGRRLSAHVAAQLADGGYRIRWEVTADDGDVVSGVIAFTVGKAAGAIPEVPSGALAVDSVVVIVSRWVLFAGLALALGGLLGATLVARVLREMATDGAGAPRPAILVGSVLGFAAASVLAAAQIGGDAPRLISTGPGRIVGVEALAFASAAFLGWLGRRRGDPRLSGAAGLVLLAVVAAEGVRAHPHADSPVWGTTLTITHLLTAALWVGALLHVLRTAHRWRDHPGWTSLLIHDYARVALLGVAVVVATGTAEAIIVVPNLAALVTTTYGLVLTAKIALVAAVVVLAVLGRRRLRTAVRTTSGSPIGRAILVEMGALVGILAVTAVLVSVTPARPVNTELPAPPLPSGPVITLGTLAGQITVIAAASAGQLVIRMTSPDRDDLGTDNADTGGAGADTPSIDRGSPSLTYRLTARLESPEAPAVPLTLLGCGPGCFTTPITWRPGVNPLRITIDAPPWSGGAALLDVPWPPRADSSMLAEVLAAMRAVPQMTVHQAVTSNYSGYRGEEGALRISGAEFLNTEPYGSGTADVVILASRPEETELGLGFPGGIAVRLFIGADRRILREEETAPNHLITSTFEYPR
jgi:copper transport protein